ncbi:MAG: hypothetical protein ACTSQK_06460 [Candidatus Heimdallarchaeota archaeon]
MATKIEKNDNETKKKIKVEKRQEFRSYYLQQRKVILSILISIYVFLNVIALVLTTYYYFVQIFLYVGIIMLLIIAGIIIIIVYEGNYLWAFLSSIIIGLIPTIEFIVGLAIAKLEGVNLILVIISLILSLFLIFVPSFLVYYNLKKRQIANEKEQE